MNRKHFRIFKCQTVSITHGKQPTKAFRFLFSVRQSRMFTSVLRSSIYKFNASVTSYPIVSLYTFLGIRLGSWYLLTGIYAATLHIGPDLAVGYLLAKFSGKFRQPFNIALAALISRTFPVFSEVKASAILGFLPRSDTSIPLIEPTSFEKKLLKFEQKLLAFLDWLKGPADQYGFSLFIASKINIVLTIFGVTAVLKFSVMDVSSILTYWGIDPKLQNGAGSGSSLLITFSYFCLLLAAAATLTNIFILPMHLWLLTIANPIVDKKFQCIKNWSLEKNNHE